MVSDEAKVTVRIPRGLLARVRALAEEDRRSLNGEILILLEAACEFEEGRTGR